MTRWANEDRWTDAIKSAAERYAVPYPLVQAIIAVESQFRPDAYRNEPQINDGSVGLMQILLRTAQAVGYHGERGTGGQQTGLFSPATNIEYGTAYLAQQYHLAKEDAAAAASAYNGGWRPSLGFGGRATKTVTVCLARDTSTGKCIRSRTVPVGEFANQTYVNAVLDNLKYFEAKKKVTTGVTQFLTPLMPSGSTNPKLLGLLVGVLAILLRLRKR